jgi:hypothetical protein
MWFRSIDLGEFRIGFKFQRENRWRFEWFLGTDSELMPPLNFPNIFRNVPHGAALVVEAKLRVSDNVLYIYFGDVRREFDQEYSVKSMIQEIEPQNIISNPFMECTGGLPIWNLAFSTV